MEIRICDLYECIPSYLKPLFDKCTYPWEVLPLIKEYAQSLIREGMEGYTKIGEDVLVGEGVEIHPSAVISGPTILGAGTVVRPGAFIRGSVICGEACVIGNSTELKNAVLLDKVQVPHYNYVGDSILGKGAHMGAGSICSNLKADKQTVIIHGHREYATNLRKVGGFLGDFADIGCGSVINPGTVVGKGTSVYPLTSLRGVYGENSIVKSAREIVKRI